MINTQFKMYRNIFRMYLTSRRSVNDQQVILLLLLIFSPSQYTGRSLSFTNRLPTWSTIHLSSHPPKSMTRGREMNSQVNDIWIRGTERSSNQPTKRNHLSHVEIPPIRRCVGALFALCNVNIYLKITNVCFSTWMAFRGSLLSQSDSNRLSVGWLVAYGDLTTTDEFAWWLTDRRGGEWLVIRRSQNLYYHSHTA